MAEANEKAAQFGYSLAFFGSSPELSALLDRAVQNDYTAARFVAELQNTDWFRTSSESARKYYALSTSDPATLSGMISDGKSKVFNLADEFGIGIGDGDAGWFAQMQIKLGWSDETLKRQLVDYIKITPKSDFTRGKAGSYQEQFNRILSDYGVKVSNEVLGTWARDALLGKANEDTIRSFAQRQAMSALPHLADRLRHETLRDIADPYIQSRAALLEIDPKAISLDDPTIRGALDSRDPKGTPIAKTLWQYEQEVRKEPAWLKTSNAQDSLMKTAKGVLNDFGVVA